MFKHLGLALACCTFVVGCRPNGPQPGMRVIGSNGSTRIGNTLANYCLSPDDGMVFVILVNGPAGFGSSSGSVHIGKNPATGSAGDAAATGYVRYGDSPKLEWSCETKDGKEKRMFVGGHEYDLDQGGLFFVDFSGKTPVVTQLNRDLSKIKSEEELEVLAKSDAQVAKFVSELKESGTKEPEKKDAP